MLKKVKKINYLIRSIKNFTESPICPFCSSKGKAIDKKYIFTSLIKCENCSLNFRHPKDTEKFLTNFYQEDYSLDFGMTTNLPTDSVLKELVDNNFEGFGGQYVPFIKSLIKRDLNGLKVIDYGCSWGFRVFPLMTAGIDVEGFEISKPRARFGIEKLSLNINSEPENIRNNNDMIISSHVIEHLPDIRKFVEMGSSKLKEDGIFMAFCPNGSEEFRKRNPAAFHGLWGLEHINYLDIDFATHLFRNNPYLILTSDTTSDWNYNFETISKWDGVSQIIGSERDGMELLIISKPNVKIK